MRLIIAIAVLFAFSSPSWAVQDYDRPYMYCPSTSKHYGKVVLGDIRNCDDAWRAAQRAQRKNGNGKVRKQ